MQNWTQSTEQGRQIGVLLFERFSNHCLANALEPLRAANTLLERQAYDWHFLTPGDATVSSSSGMPVSPTADMSELPGGAFLFVVSSYGYRDLTHRGTRVMLHRCARAYGTLVGFDTGSWLLAAAGLLDGRRATIHFEVLDRFAEAFPQVQVVRQRWVADGNRMSCSGAMASFENVLHLIGQDHGTALVLELAQTFMYETATLSQAISRLSGDRRVDACLRLMEENIERPYALPDLAKMIGTSQKDLERRFQRRLGAPPGKVYRRLRLNQAKRLLEGENLTIPEIALRCGYADASAFARAFRQEFSMAPRDQSKSRRLL